MNVRRLIVAGSLAARGFRGFPTGRERAPGAGGARASRRARRARRAGDSARRSRVPVSSIPPTAPSETREELRKVLGYYSPNLGRILAWIRSSCRTRRTSSRIPNSSPSSPSTPR